MIVIHSMMTYAKTASRWSRRTAPIAASPRRKMDADSGDMPGAGWSNGSSPGFNGSAASLSAGSFIRRTSLASCNSLASSSSSNDFEIGSSEDLVELKKLVTLVDHRKIRLLLPIQVKDEFSRNRAAKIADAMKKLKEAKFRLSF